MSFDCTAPTTSARPTRPRARHGARGTTTPRRGVFLLAAAGVAGIAIADAIGTSRIGLGRASRATVRVPRAAEHRHSSLTDDARWIRSVVLRTKRHRTEPVNQTSTRYCQLLKSYFETSSPQSGTNKSETKTSRPPRLFPSPCSHINVILHIHLPFTVVVPTENTKRT